MAVAGGSSFGSGGGGTSSESAFRSNAGANRADGIGGADLGSFALGIPPGRLSDMERGRGKVANAVSRLIESGDCGSSGKGEVWLRWRALNGDR